MATSLCSAGFQSYETTTPVSPAATATPGTPAVCVLRRMELPRQRVVIGQRPLKKKKKVSLVEKGGKLFSPPAASEQKHQRSLEVARLLHGCCSSPFFLLELKLPLLVLVSWGAALHLRVGAALRRAVGRDAGV